MHGQSTRESTSDPRKIDIEEYKDYFNKYEEIPAQRSEAAVARAVGRLSRGAHGGGGVQNCTPPTHCVV